MPRILFVTQHQQERSPGQRFRHEQYLEALRADGWECDLSPLVSPEDDKFLYAPGHYWDKLKFLGRSRRIRRADVARSKEYDVIFIYREALMSRGTYFEKQFRRSSGAKIVFDFDDAVWLPNVSEVNKRFAWIKDPGKTKHLIGMSDAVLAGNAYLADYAKRFNPNVILMPTTIDTAEYLPRQRAGAGPVVIGWSGSITTIKHLCVAIPILQRIKQKYGDAVSFKVIGDARFSMPELGIQGLPWRKATEVEDLNVADIGIMPLPNDEWARGKCGLKGLQYMALGIPTLMSPVGVNTEIIADGVNGFLPGSDEEWVQRLTELIESPDLRRRMGAEARKTVEQRYSVNAWRDRYVDIFNELIDRKTNGDRYRTEKDRAFAPA